MCTVMVSKQSCKQGNHPILHGVIEPYQKKKIDKNHDFSRVFIDFPRLLWWNIGGRPEALNSYSLTSWPELIVVIHGEYIPPGTHAVEELTIIVTGDSDASVSADGPIPQRSDLRHPHPLDEVTRQPRGCSHRCRNGTLCTPRVTGAQYELLLKITN